MIEVNLLQKPTSTSYGTTQAMRLRKIVIRSNGSGYPLEKEMSSLRTTQAIRSNDSSYPFKSIISCATVQSHLHQGTFETKL